MRKKTKIIVGELCSIVKRSSLIRSLIPFQFHRSSSLFFWAYHFEFIPFKNSFRTIVFFSSSNTAVRLSCLSFTLKFNRVLTDPPPFLLLLCLPLKTQFFTMNFFDLNSFGFWLGIRHLICLPRFVRKKFSF